MPAHELSGTTALVTGASRGFGRAIAIALSKHGAHVAADVADPVVAGQLLDQHRPRTLVLNAGAAPLTRPIHRQSPAGWLRPCRWTRRRGPVAGACPGVAGRAVLAASAPD